MLRSALSLVLLALLAQPLPVEARQTSGRDLSSAMRAEEAQVFLGAFQAIRDYSLESVADSILWERAIDGLIRELNDPYATVLSPDEVAAFEEESTGDYAGIGVQITELNNTVTITAVFRDAPADQAGLQVGDRIVEVDGESAREWTVREASSRIRGEVGTEVRVTVEREGMPEPLPHTIQRDQVHVSAVTSDRIFDDLGYVLVDRMARNAAAEVDSVLTELEGTRGLILDLRRNPGGYLDESLSMADLFLERGSVLVNTKSRTPGRTAGTREEAGHARRGARIPDKPIIVLVDRYTASAAEIVAGALQDHDRALVLGERTFGKGVVQTVLPLPGNRLIRLTTGEWYTPQGRSLHRPRDQEGRILEDESAPVEEFRSSGGRVLRGGGGVFPDLEITADTLSGREQELLAAVSRAEVPLLLRIQESAFEAAQRARTGSGPADVSPEVLTSLVSSLESAGVPGELLEDEEVKEYLLWRLRFAFFQRLDDEGRAMEVRAERDSVLSEAVRLLLEAERQGDLFAHQGAESGHVPGGR